MVHDLDTVRTQHTEEINAVLAVLLCLGIFTTKGMKNQQKVESQTMKTVEQSVIHTTQTWGLRIESPSKNRNVLSTCTSITTKITVVGYSFFPNGTFTACPFQTSTDPVDFKRLFSDDLIREMGEFIHSHTIYHVYINHIYIYGGFHKWGIPIAGWFIMENPIYT